MVDASRKGGHVIRLDGREHGDPQLVAPQLSVRLRVDDAIGAQHPGHEGGVDGSAEIYGTDNVRPLVRLSHERGRIGRGLGPAVKDLG